MKSGDPGAHRLVVQLLAGTPKSAPCAVRRLDGTLSGLRSRWMIGGSNEEEAPCRAPSPQRSAACAPSGSASPPGSWSGPRSEQVGERAARAELEDGGPRNCAGMAGGSRDRRPLEAGSAAGRERAVASRGTRNRGARAARVRRSRRRAFRLAAALCPSHISRGRSEKRGARHTGATRQRWRERTRIIYVSAIPS